MTMRVRESESRESNLETLRLIYTKVVGSTPSELFSRCVSYLFIGRWNRRVHVKTSPYRSFPRFSSLPYCHRHVVLQLCVDIALAIHKSFYFFKDTLT